MHFTKDTTVSSLEQSETALVMQNEESETGLEFMTPIGQEELSEESKKSAGSNLTDVDGIDMKDMMDTTGDYAWVIAQAAQLKSSLQHRFTLGYQEASAVHSIRNYWHKTGSLEGLTVLVAAASYEELNEDEVSMIKNIEATLSSCKAKHFDLSFDSSSKKRNHTDSKSSVNTDFFINNLQTFMPDDANIISKEFNMTKLLENLSD